MYAPDGTPEELLAISEKAMSPEPVDRYATALEMHDALSKYAADTKKVSAVMEEIFATDGARVRELLEKGGEDFDETGRVNTATMPRADKTHDPHVTDAKRTTRARAGPRFVYIGLVGAALLAVLILATRKSPEPSSAKPTDIVAPAASVKLTIRTSPATAQLTIDGVTRAAPVDLVVARGASVNVVASAPEHVTYERTIVVDSDTSLDVALSRSTLAEKAAPSATATATTTATATGAPTAIAAVVKTASAASTGAPSAAADAGAQRPVREIDDKDPYRR
jgi:hypothetical protein